MHPRLLSFAVATPAPSADSQWLVGPSPAAAQLWLQIRRVAPHFRSALLLGEPGSGAEHAAHVLHELSPHAHRPFIKLSAPEAEECFRSRLSYAQEDIIFLAELERLSPAAQNGLLQMLRRRASRSSRVIAASTRSLRTLMAATGFNVELAAALGAIQISLPALRDRSEDITALADTALQLSAKAHGLTAPSLSPCLLQAARAFSWPGNIEQLLATFEWLIEAPSAGPVLYARDLESALAAVSQATLDGFAPPAQPRLVRLEIVVQEHVRSILNACEGNKLRAAEVLGISRSTLYRMLDQIMPASEANTEFAIAV